MYLTLPSDSSFTSFPNNTTAHYVTKLSEPLRLDSDYEAGLAELIYPHSLYNVDNSDKKYWIGINPDSQDVRKHYIRSGYYENCVVLAQDLNRQAAKAFPELAINFLVNPTTNRFALEIQSKLSLYMSQELQEFLGFSGGWTATRHPTTIATYPCDLNRGLQLMFIYSDAASYSSVGDTKAPLLRVCNVSGKSGEMNRATFTHPHYFKTSRNEFETVTISINTELGKPMPFVSGKTVVTLHF
jgi:hypothetical protein